MFSIHRENVIFSISYKFGYLIKNNTQRNIEATSTTTWYMNIIFMTGGLPYQQWLTLPRGYIKNDNKPNVKLPKAILTADTNHPNKFTAEIPNYPLYTRRDVDRFRSSENVS